MYDCFTMIFIIHILHLLTFRPISCSSLKVELLFACLCKYNHLTSIKLISEDLTGRNTNFILGQHSDISFFTIFDLCAERLSNTRKDVLDVLIVSFIHYFQKINKLFLCFISIAMYMHFIICVIICSKHV